MKKQQLNDNEIDRILDEIEENEEKQNNLNSERIDIDINWKQILEAIRVKNINFIKNLITSKEIDVNSKNPFDGKTLLIYSVIIGDLDLVKIICNFGGDVHIKDNDSLDALDYAIKYGRYKITELVYYQQLSGSVGNDLKNISIQIHKKNKESSYMYKTAKKLPKLIINFMVNAIKERATFNESMLYYSWYFALKESKKNKSNPFDHKLWKIMMNVYEDILSNTSDKNGWKWLKQTFINSYIWYLPHPINNNDENNDNDEDNKMEYILKNTLFYELLKRVQKETMKQSDLLLKEKIDFIQNKNQNEWKQLISYNVNTKYSKNARQDLCGCLEAKYKESDLSQDKYPPSIHFNAKKHYDTMIYLNELMFKANILDSLFQKEMKKITKEINIEIGEDEQVIYRAGPIKTLIRSQTKTENDYINEDWPTSAKILDINRCALQFKTIKQMMTFIQIFTNKINNGNTKYIKEIIRCKNGWSIYNLQYPQYTDIKLNALLKSPDHGMIITEIQLLLDLMSSFKKKSHKLYSIQRKQELVGNYGLLTQEMSKFNDHSDINSIIKELAVNDDIKFFANLWETIEPDISYLVESKIWIDILMSKTGQINTYLKSNFKILYQKAILFYINTVCGGWNIFIKDAMFAPSSKKKKKKKRKMNDDKLQFISKLIDLFESNNKKITYFDDGIEILRSYGIIFDLLERDISLYILSDNNTFKTPSYANCVNYYHKDTQFKFVSNSFKGGSLYTYGGGLALGLGTEEKCLKPRVVATFNSDNLLKISSYSNHNLALDINGRVYSWGENWMGQLGDNTESEGRNIPYLLSIKHKAIDIAVGYFHCLILTQDGNILSFGENCDGQLGHNHNKKILIPTLIKEFEEMNINIIHISCGGSHSCAISKCNKLFCWGDNENNQCGLGKNGKKKILIPTRVDLNDKLIPLYTNCDLFHTVLLTVNGDALSWGQGWGLGHKGGMLSEQAIPKIIESLSSKVVINISCATQYSLCVTDDGELYSWGNGGMYGELGHGQTNDGEYYEDEGTPKRVNYFYNKNIKIKSCKAGQLYSCAITLNDELYVWGKNISGRFGTGNEKDLDIPTKINIFKKNQLINSICFGCSHTAVIVTNNNKQKKYNKNKNYDEKDEVKEEEEEENDVLYLKPNEEKQIITNNNNNNLLQIESFKIYIKNKILFGKNDWILLTQK